MQHSMVLTVLVGVALAGACSKGEGDKSVANTKPAAAEKSEPKATNGKAAAPTAVDVGVAAGGITHAASEGPAAVITATTGTVEIRKVGESTFAPGPKGAKLYPGDTVRTADASAATVTMADTSVVELAEISTVGIASRDGSADPGSAAAVLAGLARFSVAQRSPGEGTFRVYTPSGIVITKGTVYGVGVSANGSARVGVESGTVDVVGLSNLGADPVTVEGGGSVTLAANGTASASTPWPADDWGTWRDRADVDVEVGAAVDAHGKAMVDLEAQLTEAYAQLDIQANQIAAFEAQAAADAASSNTAAYTASLPTAEANIDASYALGGRLEALTWANAGHAELATDLYVRHPDVVVDARWNLIAPQVDAAVLWPKRFEVTASGYLQPLRGQYYLHHPRGRVQAELVGVEVPKFYASVEPPPVLQATVRAQAQYPVWTPPVLAYHADVDARPVWIDTPSMDWHAQVHASAAPMRTNVGWYVRPPSLEAKLLVGADVRGKYQSRIAMRAPEPRAKLRAQWRVPVGVKIRVAPPRADFHVKTHIAAPDVRGKLRVGIAAPAVRAKVRIAAPAVRGKVNLRVTAPVVKVHIPKPPKIKLKAGFKAGFRIGN